MLLFLVSVTLNSLLNNLFHLEKALAFSDNSAQHLLTLGESCSLFLGKCRFLIGICDIAQEWCECSCGFFCDNQLGCSLPCPQLLWERTALVQPIFRSKGVELKCWNDLIGGVAWQREILDFTNNVVQSDGWCRSWHRSHSATSSSRIVALWPHAGVSGGVVCTSVTDFTAFLSSENFWWKKPFKIGLHIAYAMMRFVCHVMTVCNIFHFLARV